MLNTGYIFSSLFLWLQRSEEEKKKQEEKFKMALKINTLTVLLMNHNRNVRKGTREIEAVSRVLEFFNPVWLLTSLH